MYKIYHAQALLALSLCLPLMADAAVGTRIDPNDASRAKLIARDGYRGYSDRGNAFDDDVNYDYRWENHDGRRDVDLRSDPGYDRGYGTGGVEAGPYSTSNYYQGGNSYYNGR